MAHEHPLYNLDWSSSAFFDCHMLFSESLYYRAGGNDNLGNDGADNNALHTHYICLYCCIHEYLQIQFDLLRDFQLYDLLVYLREKN